MSIDAAIIIISSSTETGSATMKFGPLAVPRFSWEARWQVTSLRSESTRPAGLGKPFSTWWIWATGPFTTSRAPSCPSMHRTVSTPGRELWRTMDVVPEPVHGDWTPTSGYLATLELLRKEAPQRYSLRMTRWHWVPTEQSFEAGLRIPRTSPSSDATTSTRPVNSHAIDHHHPALGSSRTRNAENCTRNARNRHADLRHHPHRSHHPRFRRRHREGETRTQDLTPHRHPPQALASPAMPGHGRRASCRVTVARHPPASSRSPRLRAAPCGPRPRID